MQSGFNPIRLLSRALVGAVLAALAAVALLVPSGAQASGSVLYQDNFDGLPSGQAPPGWSGVQYWKTAAASGDGFVRVTNSVSGAMGAGSGAWAAVTATARLRIDPQGYDVHLGLRWRDPNDYYGCGITSSGEVSLLLMVGGSKSTHLAPYPGGIARDTWYSVSFAVAGSSLSCSVGAAPAVTATDAGLPTGEVGATTFGPASLDDVVVSSSAAPPPTPVPPVPHPTSESTPPAQPASSAAALPGSAPDQSPPPTGGGVAVPPGISEKFTQPAGTSSDPSGLIGFLLPEVHPLPWAGAISLVCILAAVAIHRRRQLLVAETLTT